MTLNSRVQHTLRALLDDRHFLAQGGTLAFPCAHLYHQDAHFQRAPRPLSRQTVSVLKGRDHTVAMATITAGLEVTLTPYVVETCVDETWQLEHFPTLQEQAALGGQMEPTDLEEALAIQAHSEGARDFDVVWVEPPPHFNRSPTMYPGIAEGRLPAPDPEFPRWSTSTAVSTVPPVILATKAATLTSMSTVCCMWSFLHMVKELVRRRKPN